MERQNGSQDVDLTQYRILSRGSGGGHGYRHMACRTDETDVGIVREKGFICLSLVSRLL